MGLILQKKKKQRTEAWENICAFKYSAYTNSLQSRGWRIFTLATIVMLAVSGTHRDHNKCWKNVTMTFLATPIHYPRMPPTKDTEWRYQQKYCRYNETTSCSLQSRGEPSGQATQALLALFTLSLLVPFPLCLNTLYFNYLKQFFIHLFVFLWIYLLVAAGFGAEECCPLFRKLKTPQLADHR